MSVGGVHCVRHPRTVHYTGKDNTVYNILWLDAPKESGVVEVPPKLKGVVNAFWAFWHPWVGDIGIQWADQNLAAKCHVV